MIKLFRNIRKNLLNEGKTTKYFKYAIGEIVLVVIGIFIALQLNNWNQERQEKIKLDVYFEKMLDELDQEVLITAQNIKNIDSLGILQKRSLEILSTKDSKDIPELMAVLGSVATSWSSSESAEIFDEFMAQGLLSQVADDNLKQALRNLKDVMNSFKIMDNFVDNQYNTLIEPFFAKNINYAMVALPRYKDNLLQGGPKTDFEALFNSMELWNVTTLKLETTNEILKRLRLLERTINQLIVELKKNVENQ